MERRELRLHYQPFVELAMERTVGVEALLRWQHPDLGLLAASQFLPGAGDCVLRQVGAWVLEEASWQLSRWRGEHGTGRWPSVTVNLAAQQVRDPGFIELVAGVLSDTGVEPAALGVEIPEALLVSEPKTSIEALRQLKALGVYTIIDYFAGGTSCLSSLVQAPIDMVKLDRSIVSRLGVAGVAASLCASVVALAGALGFEVTAVGIETPLQSAEALRLGCDYGQGYHFSRSLPAEMVTALTMSSVG